MAAVAVRRRSIDASTARNTIDISPLQLAARLPPDTVGASRTSASSSGSVRERREHSSSANIGTIASRSVRRRAPHGNERRPATDPSVMDDSASAAHRPQKPPPRPAANRSPAKNKRRFQAAVRRVTVCLLFRAGRIRASRPPVSSLPLPLVLSAATTTYALHRSANATPSSPSLLPTMQNRGKRDTRADTRTTADRSGVRIRRAAAAAGGDGVASAFRRRLSRDQPKVDAHPNTNIKTLCRSRPPPGLSDFST